MPKASVTRLIERDKKTLIDFVLILKNIQNLFRFVLLQKYTKKRGKDSINIIADLTIGKRPFTDTYKSDVRFYKTNDHIHVTNIDGPLKYLENNWKFIEKDNFTEVHFDVDFELKNKFLNIIMTKSFQFGLNKIADAFQKRAESL